LDPHPDFVGWKDPRRVWRIASETCVPIAMEDRVFEIPAGIGQADIWYGYNECEWDEDQYAQMLAKRQRLETYLTELQAPKSDSTIVEAKVRRKHRQIERRANVRGIAFQRGLTCEACGFSAKDKDPIWSSAIEVHHLVPFADLEVGEHRVISDKDLAVLCANCHRAIHRTPNPSDIKAFKDTFMAT
ncbi:MAG: HNH endonuclease, partial [Primorskyibacter sp.]